MVFKGVFALACALILCSCGLVEPVHAAGEPIRLTPEAGSLLGALDAAEKVRGNKLRELLARIDIDQVVRLQPAPLRIYLYLRLSKAQRRLNPELQRAHAAYLDAAILESKRAGDALEAAVLVETLLVLRRDEGAASEFGAPLVTKFSAFSGATVRQAASLYGEATDRVYRAANYVARRAKLAVLLPTLARRHIDAAVDEFGNVSLQHATARGGLSLVLSPDVGAHAELERVDKLFEELVATGKTQGLGYSISIPNDVADVSSMQHLKDGAAQALKLASRAAARAMAVKLPQEDAVEVAENVRATARQLSALGKRPEALPLLRTLAAWGPTTSLPAHEMGEVLRDLVASEVLSGHIDEAKRGIRGMEGLAVQDGDERASQERWLRESKAIVALAEMKSSPQRDVFTDPLLRRIRAKSLAPAVFEEVLKRAESFMPMQRLLVYDVLLQHESVRGQPVRTGRVALALAEVHRHLLNLDLADATLRAAEVRLRPISGEEGRLLGLLQYQQGRLQTVHENHAEAAAKYQATLATWKTARIGEPHDTMAVLHWLATSQSAAGAYSAARLSVAELQRVRVTPALRVTRQLAVAAASAHILARTGDKEGAKKLLLESLRDYAGDVGPQTSIGPLPSWPVVTAMKSFAAPERAVVKILAREAFLSLDGSCDRDHALRLSLFNAQAMLPDELPVRIGQGFSVGERLVGLGELLWGSDLLADLVVAAARASNMAVARLAYRSFMQQQAQSLTALPRASRARAGSSNEPLIDMMAALQQERALMSARTAKEAADVVLSLTASMQPPRTAASSVIDVMPIPGSSFVELVAFAASEDAAGRCLPQNDRASQVSVFVVSGGELQEATLGAPLDALVADERSLRRAILAGEANKSTELAVQLHSRLFGMHLQRLSNMPVVAIRADTSVSNVPFSYLFWAAGNRAAVRMLPAGLPAAATTNTPARTVSVFANPDYGMPRVGQRPSLGPLSGGEKEAAHIRDALGGDFQLYDGPNATVAALLSVQQPAVLHLATHAFIDERLSLVAGRTGGIGRLAMALTGPRLALAGANDNSPGFWSTGVLSVLTFSSLNLRNTQLVVFSACDAGQAGSALGYLNTGLSLAAHQAGARTVVSSLWRVSDVASIEFMRHFYSALARRTPPSQALAFAQGKMRTSAEFGAPEHWAGYVVSGADAPLNIE